MQKDRKAHDLFRKRRRNSNILIGDSGKNFISNGTRLCYKVKLSDSDAMQQYVDRKTKNKQYLLKDAKHPKLQMKLHLTYVRQKLHFFL